MRHILVYLAAPSVLGLSVLSLPNIVFCACSASLAAHIVRLRASTDSLHFFPLNSVLVRSQVCSFSCAARNSSDVCRPMNRSQAPATDRLASASTLRVVVKFCLSCTAIELLLPAPNWNTFDASRAELRSCGNKLRSRLLMETCLRAASYRSPYCSFACVIAQSLRCRLLRRAPFRSLRFALFSLPVIQSLPMPQLLVRLRCPQRSERCITKASQFYETSR